MIEFWWVSLCLIFVTRVIRSLDSCVTYWHLDNMRISQSWFLSAQTHPVSKAAAMGTNHFSQVIKAIFAFIGQSSSVYSCMIVLRYTGWFVTCGFVILISLSVSTKWHRQWRYAQLTCRQSSGRWYLQRSTSSDSVDPYAIAAWFTGCFVTCGFVTLISLT